MTDPDKPRIAVALHYEKPHAPRVVAIGHGLVAERIVDVARQHNVAISQNLALAEALAKVELDKEIPENLYRAVAQVLGFILRAAGHLR